MSKRKVVHIEIPAVSGEAAAKFYHEVFGWDYQVTTEPVTYAMFTAENLGGSYPELDEQFKPGEVTVYIESDDIDVDLAKIESLGGKQLMPKTEVPGFGWMAWFADPTGNRMALWTAMMGQQGN